jgi:DNA-binding CsgD family transcriptional regulator
MSTERSSSVEVDRNDYGLSSLELQIIALVAAGFSHKESARRMGVSEQTFQHQLKNLLDKLRVSNRLELVLFALHHRLIREVRVSPYKSRLNRRCVVRHSSPSPSRQTVGH